jgi:streptogramin lyase
MHRPNSGRSQRTTPVARSNLEQLNVGYGSVWVSQKAGRNVVRLDPETGEVLATVDVGTEPLKLQPAAMTA